MFGANIVCPSLPLIHRLSRSPFPAGEGKLITSLSFLNFGMSKHTHYFIYVANVRTCSLDLPRRGRGTASAVDEGKRRGWNVHTCSVRVPRF